MNRREQFYKTISYEDIEVPAFWLGIPTTNALPGLFKYFHVNSMIELKQKIKDNIWPIELPYHNPPTNHICCAFDFALGNNSGYEDRSLTGDGFFANATDMSIIEKFNWPDPLKHMDAKSNLQAVNEVPEDFIKLGVLWSAHFQDACAAFGMENALVAMLETPEIFEAVHNRIVEFYLKANKFFYDTTEGKLDAVLIGNDFGTQNSLIVAPDLIRQYVIPGIVKLVDQAHEYNLKVIYHSCGAIYPVIDDLIKAGVDIIHPIQALAAGMDAANLKSSFADRVAFCGGIDCQHLLVNGTPEQIIREVCNLRKIFPSGLILSPSHEAILEDIPPENIEAMINAATKE